MECNSYMCLFVSAPEKLNFRVHWISIKTKPVIIYLFTQLCTRAHACIHTCTNTHTYTHMHEHTRRHTHKHKYSCASTHTHTYTNTGMQAHTHRTRVCGGSHSRPFPSLPTALTHHRSSGRAVLAQEQLCFILREN